MSITVNTNMQAIRIQGNLNSATTKMNTAMERMSSGYRINRAKDDAAGFAVSATFSKNISGAAIAKNNVAMGNDLLATAEGSLGVVQANLERIRDLTEQAANGTYSTDDLEGIATEVTARLEQIHHQQEHTTFNGKDLLNGSQSDGIQLQVGSEAGNTYTLSGDIFKDIDTNAYTPFATGGSSDLAAAIRGGNPSTISGLLADIDTAITNVIERTTKIGAASNRLDALSEGLDVQKTNMTSALSTVKDADIAEESAKYVQQQILQSASATLLTQANSAPQIALTLIQG